MAYLRNQERERIVSELQVGEKAFFSPTMFLRKGAKYG